MDSSLSLSGPISRTIKTQYGNIAAYKKGAGSRTVLLLHGAGCDSTMLSWREVFNTFSDDYSVYALRYPEDVKALIPVDTWGVSEKMPFHRFSYWYVMHTDLTLSQYRWCAKYRWIARWSISYALIGNKKLITDALVDEVMQSCAGDMAGKSMLNFQRSAADKKRSKPYYPESFAVKHYASIAELQVKG